MAVTVIQLLEQLRALDVRVWVDGDRLRYDAPRGAMSAPLRDRLRDHQDELLRLLRAAAEVEHASCYIPVRDGVRLAADVFRPRRGGAVVEQPLPVLWCQERYHRSERVDGVLLTKLDSHPWLRDVVRAGYVVAVVDGRGTGASTGVRTSEFSDEEVADTYDVTEWFADQPWCDGAVGMFGDSYRGIIQYLAAAAGPPHLRAIFPQMAMFDLYAFLRPGGVFRDDFARQWGALVRRLDTEQAPVPVTGSAVDVDDVRAQHLGNDDVFAAAERLPCRDSVDPRTAGLPYRDRSPSSAVDRINAGRVAIHHLAGWYDLWVRDAVLWFANLTGPQRLTIGGWCHNARAGIDLAAEHVRWYDYWLKGIDNGVMDEPPVRYYVMNGPPSRPWRSAHTWPPPQARQTPFYFHAGPTGTVGSVNDGRLGTEVPDEPAGVDRYTVDYTTTSGRTTRWANGYGAPFGYQLTANDGKALTYTSAPLERDVEVTGHPVAHLFVTSTHADGDFFVYLEEVDEHGEVHYVSEGVLRASHRALAPPPARYLNLPYHPGTAASLSALPAEPVELVFDLHPTSNVFGAGRRIRVSVTCCDRDNADTPVCDPSPTVGIHRSAPCPSYLCLPVMPDSAPSQPPLGGS